MRGFRKIFLTILTVIALSHTLFAMGSKDSGKPKLKGVMVSKDGQIYPKGTSYLTLDVAGDNSFTFTAICILSLKVVLFLYWQFTSRTGETIPIASIFSKPQPI